MCKNVASSNALKVAWTPLAKKWFKNQVIFSYNFALFDIMYFCQNIMKISFFLRLT